jgi:hypothetical protein
VEAVVIDGVDHFAKGGEDGAIRVEVGRRRSQITVVSKEDTLTGVRTQTSDHGGGLFYQGSQRLRKIVATRTQG